MGLTLRFGVAPPDRLIADAVAAARKADVAVVFAGERVGEGMDRHYLALQGDQDRLIEAVAAANPNTVVVLSTGGPVAMPWLGKVRGVLETWLPGDAFGPAIAGMLFGDREPGGRLPVTFPADETQGPAAQRREFPGLTDPATGRLSEAYFDEGVFVGYRYYQAHSQKPLFPFGSGLGYGDVAIAVEGVVNPPAGGQAVRMRLTNSGKRPVTSIPQLYVGLPAETGEPPLQLKGFAKAVLAPGESRVVEIPLPSSSFIYWDDKGTDWTGRRAIGWRFGNGSIRLAIGRSADDLLWEGTLPVVISN
jgi:beta-glucosidase